MQSKAEGKYPPIENYAIIGDLITAALIGPRACIDCLCFPEFDSPSVFAAHVDREKGGHFIIEPLLDEYTERKLYFPGTNILLSRFLSRGGIAEVSDFMMVWEGSKRQALIRRAKAVHGNIRFTMRCAPRFNYARAEHTVEQNGENEIVFTPKSGGQPPLRLKSDVRLKLDEGDAVAHFELEQESHATFILEPANAEHEEEIPDLSSAAFKRTENYWREWIARCTYTGRWQETVHRSALALKLMTSRRHGSIVAAPSFGFPNDMGGERNWDYRRAWLRDAAFTVYAFMRIGYTKEAKAFTRWLENRIRELGEGDELQIMYRMDGSPVAGEFHLEHLVGYRNSRPVRIGTTNHEQLQLDIYGELMDTVYVYDKYGEMISQDLWSSIGKLIDYVLENWKQPDASIWEVRDDYREFLYSRVMCWVAIDRAVRLATKRSLPAPVEKWREVRDEIYRTVFDEFWDEDRQAFVQFKGAKAVDAAALIMPLVRIISPSDPRWLSTLKAIEDELAEDSLVYRYRINTEFPEHLEGSDGSFSICSFWFVECVSRSGDLQKARYLFEKMLSYASPVGLFAEQIGPRGEALGNIPQAFTHLALISAAHDLDRRLRTEPGQVSGGCY